QRAPGEREQDDQVRRVVEREAEPELLPSIVLVEEPRQRHRGQGDPEESPKPRTLPWEEKQREQRGGDEQAHPVGIVPQPEWLEIELWQEQEGRAEVAPEVVEAEE